MFNLKRWLLGGTSAKAERQARIVAETARLQAIANEPPPPGIGWRCGDQDSEGKWTVWNGARKIASFWDENEAQEWARRNNADQSPRLPVVRDDGKYCVNCGSHEPDDSLKLRGYVSCCPERYVIPEAWCVTESRLATGQWHLWRPADGVGSIDAETGWVDREEAQHEADHRNLLEFRNVALKPAALAGSPDAADALAFGLTAVMDESGFSAGCGVSEAPPNLGRFRCDGKYDIRDSVYETPEAKAARKLAEFLNVPIPDGVRLVVGPRKSPTDGNWWTFDRSGPVRGYTRKTNAQAAADRANNAPQT